jgi:glycosyltransferase involved in cell wall biosynthesis
MEQVSITDIGLSIVIPTTGNENLSLLLESIHADSSLANHEVIIVGSTNALNTIQNICPEYGCINKIEQNIPNVSLSRNLGISQAKLKYISLIDDDDLWLDKRAEELLKAVRINPSYIVFGSALFIDERTNKAFYKIYEQEVNRTDVLNQFSRPFFLKQKLFLQVGNCAFSRELQVPKFREELHYLEDQIWILDVLSVGIGIKQVRSVTLNYKFSRQRSSRRWSVINEKNIYKILNQKVPTLGNKYILHTSLKSLAISSDRERFISAKKNLLDNFDFRLVDKLRFLVLSIVNFMLNLK